MKRTIAVFVALATLSFSAKAAVPVISQSDKDRAASLVQKMTLEEKCLLIAGQVDGFHTAAIERLGIPSVRMADGPQGVRNNTHSTYYPCGISLAASFNREVAKGVGTGIGYDAKARGVGIMLCPGVNIYRSPLCGRNFEYYGEDPYLASETAASYITGMQEQGVMSTIKHFALNNQEYDRHWVNSSAGERVINEIYFATFRKAVEQAHVACVMTSYNPLNNVHAAENPWLIRENLRKWGHEGIVMSDWTSTYTTLGCVQGGLDLEMPKGYVLNYASIKPLIENGSVTEAEIDEKCQHILQTFIAYGFLDKSMIDKTIPEDYEPSRNLAYNAAIEGPVLLKNEDDILPLKGGNIIVLGPNADYVAFGGGSGRMDPIEGRAITLYQGLQNLGKPYKVTLQDWKNPDMEAIAKAKAVIFAAGFSSVTEKEGSDRLYTLPDSQNEAILKVAQTNPNVVVVANSGGEFDILPWKDSVKAILMGWYAGQEGGNALAAIISGKVSPSGRLPFTFWGSVEKNPAAPYYGIDSSKEKGESKGHVKRFGNFPSTYYTEGLFLGYRGVAKFGVEPLYPFGYGLTYSSFGYSDMKVAFKGDAGFELSFTLANTGKKEASEVAQVYVAPRNPSVLRPERELKGYAKVKLAKGAKQNVTITLPLGAFSYYDASAHCWKVDTGDYTIMVGASSADIRLKADVVLPDRN